MNINVPANRPTFPFVNQAALFAAMETWYAANCGCLVPVASLKPLAASAIKSGGTYSNCLITGECNAAKLTGSITISHCVWNGNGAPYCLDAHNTKAKFTVTDTTLYNVKSCFLYGTMTASRCYLHQSAGDIFKLTSGARIDQCWAKDAGYNNASAHADFVQIVGDVQDVQISNCFVDLASQDKPTITKSNAVIMAGPGTIKNITVTGCVTRDANYLFILKTGGAYSGWTITQNIFPTAAKYGYLSGKCANLTWSNQDETGIKIGPGGGKSK